MKTVLSGRVRKQHLADAEFLMGIVPTSFLTNGDTTPPVSQLPTEVNPPCPNLPGELGEHQRNYTLCLAADAVICVGENEHLVGVARKYGLPVYEVAR